MYFPPQFADEVYVGFHLRSDGRCACFEEILAGNIVRPTIDAGANASVGRLGAEIWKTSTDMYRIREKSIYIPGA